LGAYRRQFARDERATCRSISGVNPASGSAPNTADRTPDTRRVRSCLALPGWSPDQNIPRQPETRRHHFNLPQKPFDCHYRVWLSSAHARGFQQDWRRTLRRRPHRYRSTKLCPDPSGRLRRARAAIADTTITDHTTITFAGRLAGGAGARPAEQGVKALAFRIRLV
jgi:hypothetical protein